METKPTYKLWMQGTLLGAAIFGAATAGSLYGTAHSFRELRNSTNETTIFYDEQKAALKQAKEQKFLIERIENGKQKAPQMLEDKIAEHQCFVDALNESEEVRKQKKAKENLVILIMTSIFSGAVTATSLVQAGHYYIEMKNEDPYKKIVSL